MIAAYINGAIKEIETGTTVSALVIDLDIAHKKIALEINGEIISRSQFKSQILQDGDQIEIVMAVGGG
ncbi:MAG: sulfur carrier protein ThiS [Proteobacteria bacterium]|nr:sulfur carrier protein ThiS [Pseudomonadota bacterium]MDA1332298.1 sulfur carrier protein ThiS [Pseudomonadota bacterium]